MKTYARHYTLKALVKQFKWEWAMTSEMTDKSHAYQLNHKGEVAISTAQKMRWGMRGADNLASVFAVTPKGISVLTNYIDEPEIEVFFSNLFKTIFSSGGVGMSLVGALIKRQERYRHYP